MRDLKLINSDLTARHVVQILTEDNPNATDEQDGYNLELEVHGTWIYYCGDSSINGSIHSNLLPNIHRFRKLIYVNILRGHV